MKKCSMCGVKDGFIYQDPLEGVCMVTVVFDPTLEEYLCKQCWSRLTRYQWIQRPVDILNDKK